ncbi:MAG: hypothetical protein ACKPKO_01975, partial [Candidatus Fonsibacter sp.]
LQELTQFLQTSENRPLIYVWRQSKKATLGINLCCSRCLGLMLVANNKFIDESAYNNALIAYKAN